MRHLFTLYTHGNCAFSSEHEQPGALFRSSSSYLEQERKSELSCE